MNEKSSSTDISTQALARAQGFVASRLGWVEQIDAFLRERTAPGDRFLLAVSGGADSMGMLALLHDELKVAVEQLVAGHVQHGIRATEHRDLKVIEQEAGTRGIRVLAQSVNAPALAKHEGLSLEAAARRVRYRALEEMAEEAGCRWILTAHTLDDSAETVWMRMKSGAPWYEWTGIPRQRGRILRPLLKTSRDELRAWVADRRIAFVEDETNADQQFSRNRARTEMVRFEAVWDVTRKQELAKLGEILERSLEVQRQLARRLPVAFRGQSGGGSIGLAIDRIFIYFKSLTFLPVEVAWADLTGKPEARLSSAIRRQIMDVLAGSAPESVIMLPNGVRLMQRRETAWVVRNLPQLVDREVSVGSWPVPEVGGMLTIISNGSGPGSHLASRFAEKPLRLRTWRAGDRIKIARRPEKLISDLLNEARLDPATREATLVLADDYGPVMILGGPIAERALPTEHDTQSLLVTWTTDAGTSDQD